MINWMSIVIKQKKKYRIWFRTMEVMNLESFFFIQILLILRIRQFIWPQDLTLFRASKLKYELKAVRGVEHIEEEIRHEEHRGKDQWSKTTKRVKKSATKTAGSLSVSIEKEASSSNSNAFTSSSHEIV